MTEVYCFHPLYFRVIETHVISLFGPNASGSRWIPNRLVTDAAWREPDVDVFFRERRT